MIVTCQDKSVVVSTVNILSASRSLIPLSVHFLIRKWMSYSALINIGQIRDLRSYVLAVFLTVISLFQVSNARPEDSKIRQEDFTKILASVQSVHSKQENIDARLAALKR